MSLTEAIHFYTTKKITRSMVNKYSHFSPTWNDYKVREEYQKRLNAPKRKISKDLFE